MTDRIEQQTYQLGLEVQRLHPRSGAMLNGFLDLVGALALAGVIGVVLWVIR